MSLLTSLPSPLLRLVGVRSHLVFEISVHGLYSFHFFLILEGIQL